MDTTNTLKFYEGEGIERQLGRLQPDDFLFDMVRTEQLDSISDNYSRDVYKMCKIAVTWMMSRLKMTGEAEDMLIVKGEYHGDEHFWIEIGGYIVDLTLAQFEEDAPQLAILKLEDIDPNDSLVGLTYDPIEKLTYGEALVKTFQGGL